MSKYQDLIKDIYNLLESPDYEISEDNLEIFLARVGDSLRDAFKGKARVQREKKLVASNFGLPLRRLWYEMNVPRRRTRSN